MGERDPSAGLVVEGGERLSGVVQVQGAKNAVQKLIPAAIVVPGVYVLRNFPDLQDAKDMLALAEHVGVDVRRVARDIVELDTRRVESVEIPPSMTARTTGSFLFAGALLSRCGRAKVWHPGGDKIGARPVTWHLDAFKQFGATVRLGEGYYEVEGTRLCGCAIALPKVTVGGTTNALIVAAKAKGRTTITPAAREPEIDNAIELLVAAGCNVSREGETLVVEETSSEFAEVDIRVIPDRNDAATLLTAAALVGDVVEVAGIVEAHVKPYLELLDSIGALVGIRNDTNDVVACVRAARVSGDRRVMSAPYPGFPTDWGPMVQVLFTQLPGRHVFEETIFVDRFAHLQGMERMGARVALQPTIAGRRVLEILGPVVLKGATVSGDNVRGCAALLLAALAASGESVVFGGEHLERGYQDLPGRLREVGARIHWSA